MGQPHAGERESRHFQQYDHEAEQRYQPFDARTKGESFLLKVDKIHIDNVDGDDLGASRSEPAESGGARNTSSIRALCRSVGRDPVRWPSVLDRSIVE